MPKTAKNTLEKLFGKTIEQIISELSQVCKENLIKDSDIIGQLRLPDSGVYPENEVIFRSTAELGARSQMLRRFFEREIKVKNAQEEKIFILRAGYIANLLVLYSGKKDGSYSPEAAGEKLKFLRGDSFSAQVQEAYEFLTRDVLVSKGVNELFGSSGEINGDFASALLFESKKSGLLSAKVKRQWQSTDFEKDVCYSCAENIIAKSIKLPLIRHYLESPELSEKQAEVRNLYRLIVSKVTENRDEIIINSVVSSVFNHLKTEIKRLCTINEFAPYDLENVLKRIAMYVGEKDSRDEGYHFSETEIDKDLIGSVYLGGNEDSSNAVRLFLTCLCREENTALLTKDDEGYRFTLKPVRIVLLGMKLAEEINEKSAADYSWLLSQIKRYSRFDENKKNDLVTLDAHYDELVILSSALIWNLRQEYKQDFLEYLTRVAGDFSIGKRNQQVIAVYILSHLLYEGVAIDGQLQKKIFYVTFGHTMYELQLAEWNMLRKNGAFYINEVKRVYDRLYKFDSEKKLLVQPHFFFLFHEVADRTGAANSWEKLLYDAYSYRALSWNSMKTVSVGDIRKISELSDRLYSRYSLCKADADLENSARLAYAVQAYLYTLANLSYKNARDVIFDKSRLTELMFISDSFLRKHSPTYSAKLNGGEGIEMYLLCGALRFTSSTKPEKDNIYKMPEEMKKEYQAYLSKEMPRYKILILRMLSFSDFFGDENSIRLLEELSDETLRDDMFLPYDNISVKKIKKYPLEPEKWYRE